MSESNCCLFLGLTMTFFGCGREFSCDNFLWYHIFFFLVVYLLWNSFILFWPFWQQVHRYCIPWNTSLVSLFNRSFTSLIKKKKKQKIYYEMVFFCSCTVVCIYLFFFWGDFYSCQLHGMKEIGPVLNVGTWILGLELSAIVENVVLLDLQLLRYVSGCFFSIFLI